MDPDLSVHDARQVVFQGIELRSPGREIVSKEHDQELDLVVGPGILLENRAVNPELGNPAPAARVADPVERHSRGQLAIDLPDAHRLPPSWTGTTCRLTAERINSDTLSYGSVISRKAQRPNPPCLFTAGAQSVRTVAVFASFSFLRSPVTSRTKLSRLSQERIRRETRHFAQSVQSNMFVLKLGPLDKNDNRIRAGGDEISKIVTNSYVAPRISLDVLASIVTMYIRKTVRRYKDKTYVNFLLVESVLTDKGPRQKVICSLGDLSPRPPEQWLALARKLQDALTGQLSLPGMADEDPELQQLRHVLPVPTAAPMDVDSTTTSSPGDLVFVHIDRVTSDTPRPAGHIHVGLEFWKRLGLDDILKSLGFSPWLVSLTCAMTLNRLIHPAAEYAMPDWIRSTAMTDILGVDFSRLPDDPLYRNLDRLHPH